MIKQKESDIKQKAVTVTKDIIFILARGEWKKVSNYKF